MLPQKYTTMVTRDTENWREVLFQQLQEKEKSDRVAVNIQNHSDSIA